jgi:hypothetical protein
MNCQGNTPLENTITPSRRSRILVCQKADNPVAGCVETIKHRFLDFKQIVICGFQKAGNEILGLFHHFKYGLIDFTEVAFYDICR